VYRIASGQFQKLIEGEFGITGNALSFGAWRVITYVEQQFRVALLEEVPNCVASGCPPNDFLGSPKHFLSPKITPFLWISTFSTPTPVRNK
jgi:hypothetical protein